MRTRETARKRQTTTDENADKGGIFHEIVQEARGRCTGWCDGTVPADRLCPRGCREGECDAEGIADDWQFVSSQSL